MEEKEEGVRTIIGGDFNARVGSEGGGIEKSIVRGEIEKRERKTKNGKVNKDGRRLVEFVEGRGWGLLNGCIKGDEEGQFTFSERKGNTVIDFVIVDEEVGDGVERMRVGDRVDSDHHPIEAWIKGEEMWKRGKTNMERDLE